MTSFSNPEIYFKHFRIQIISSCLLRFEKKDSTGYENQATFHVLSREFDFADLKVKYKAGNIRFSTGKISFEVPVYAQKLSDISFKTQNKHFKINNPSLKPQNLPEPGNLPDFWLFADYPRLVPPEHGATAPGRDNNADFLSGWQISDCEEDFYIFFPAAGGYENFRKNVLDLTGQIPLIPRYLLGFIYSRYYPYSDSQIYEVLRKLVLHKMPPDVFVVNTDWRENASSGYQVNKKLFPDLETFFKIMHDKNVKIMFNDHPEPFTDFALSPTELKQREGALGKFLKMGLDCWWYDRNWKVSLDEPAPGLGKDIWGMRLYYEITEKIKPENRPLILSNVPGIRHGYKTGASNITSHRYPFWWTGDTDAEWHSLKRAVENAVNEGIKSLMPYVSEDIGGHFGMPSDELYARYLQFAAFSPVFRIHCSAGLTRDPWDFNEETQRIFANYLGLRLKLLPAIYSAAVQANCDGLPLLQRCDFKWPSYKEASNASQYLFCENLLVAPIFEPVKKNQNSKEQHAVREVWIPPGLWHDTWSGSVYRGPTRKFLQCPQWVTPLLARNGSIIISQPRITNSAMQNWQELVLDVFVPETSMNKTFKLYEDDGVSNKYLEGEQSVTNIELERNSIEMTLRIDSPDGNFSQGFKNRNWLIRLHFSQFSKLGSISLNNNFILPGDYHFIKNFERPASLPFVARPGFSGRYSGQTFEIPLKNFPLSNKAEFRLKII